MHTLREPVFRQRLKAVTNYRRRFPEARAQGLLLYDISGEGAAAKTGAGGEAMPESAE